MLQIGKSYKTHIHTQTQYIICTGRNKDIWDTWQGKHFMKWLYSNTSCPTCPQTRVKFQPTRLGMMCGQSTESTSHWLSRQLLSIQVSSYPNSSQCLFGTGPHFRWSKPRPLNARQLLCLCATTSDPQLENGNVNIWFFLESFSYFSNYLFVKYARCLPTTRSVLNYDSTFFFCFYFEKWILFTAWIT